MKRALSSLLEVSIIITTINITLCGIAFSQGGEGPSSDPGMIISISPTIINADGQNHTVTISGSGFTTSTLLFIDESQLTSTFVDSETITFVANYSSTGVHTVDIRGDANAAPVSSTGDLALFAIKTGELAVYPPYGTNSGGTKISIYGLNSSFEAGASVYFDTSNGNCSSLTSVPNTQFVTSRHLEAITPAVGTSGFSSIFVDNPTLPDLCKTNAFEYASSSSEISVRNSEYQTDSTLPPSSMEISSTATVIINMKNTGTESWTRAAGYKLAILAFDNTSEEGK